MRGTQGKTEREQSPQAYHLDDISNRGDASKGGPSRIAYMGKQGILIWNRLAV